MAATEYDLIIIGAGSGNSIPEEMQQWRIAMVEEWVFGGTCLNRGCIPTKMFVYTADVARGVREAARYNLSAELTGADWKSIQDRVFAERIDPIAAGGENYRRNDCPTIDVYGDRAAFVGPKTLRVGGTEITAPQILIAAGARPSIPPISGLGDVTYYTSDDVMRIDELPQRMLILGGGFIATELSHIFCELGVDVTIVNRGPQVLRAQDSDVSLRYTELLQQHCNVMLNEQILGVEERDGVITATLTSGATVETDLLVIATGRTPNGDQLNVEATGLELNDDGRILTNAAMQTAVDGVYALGDVTSEYQLKHVANAEGRIAFHNLAHPDDLREMSYAAVPHAVFGSPQIGSVGLTEHQARERGYDFMVATKDFGATAYGWAMQDETSFVKVIADRQTRKILGAHVIGEQGSTLVQLLVQAMSFGQTVDEVAHGQLWIHPALTEVIENCLLEFPPAD